MGRNVEKQHPTSITLRGGGPGTCRPRVRENRPGRRGEAVRGVGPGSSRCCRFIPHYKYCDRGKQGFNLHTEPLASGLFRVSGTPAVGNVPASASTTLPTA